MKKFLSYWMPVILYAGFIFFISNLSSKSLPSYFKYDKIIHLAEYLILGILLARAIKNFYPKLNLSKIFIIVILAATFYGISDELHQSFVPGRVVDFADVVADGIGGALGHIIYFRFK